MAKPCRCKKPGECEECPEWIFTFADLVMLMMGFFVILWVLKPPAGADGKKDAAAEQKWLETVGDIRKGFGYQPTVGSNDPVDKAMLQVPRVGRKDGDEEVSRRSSAKGTSSKTETIRDSKHAAEGGRLLFAAGQAELSPDTRRALDEIGEIIRGHKQIVIIKGHASRDDLPDNNTEDARMELSVQRARAARNYLISRGVSGETLRVQGASSDEPVRQRKYGAEGQMENRRVEIEVSANLVEERQDTSQKARPLHPSAKEPSADKPISKHEADQAD